MCKKTRSEVLFEQFCVDSGIRCQPIEEQESKTPDYEIWLGEHRIIVEVKQLDQSETDRKIRDQVRERGRAAYFDEPGRRVRIKIDSAKKQLKALSDGIHPTLLVLYDNVSIGALDPGDIKTAMYGAECAILAVPEPPGGPTAVIDVGFGPGRRLTPETNTTISAIALLHELCGTLHLEVYHNVYAKNPIDPEWLRRDTVSHYSLNPEIRGAWQEWTTI